MSPLTQQQINDHLYEATTSKARMTKYSKLLGIDKRKKSTSTRRPTYDGKIGGFYKAIKKVTSELSKKYESSAELQKEVRTQENFTESLIDDTIEKYGPEIWNDGKDGFETIIDDEGDGEPSYPRHLIYSNESDRSRIRTFTYCLTLKSICQYKRTTGHQSGADGIRARRSTMTAPGPDTMPSEPTRTMPATPTSSTTSEDEHLQDTFEYHVPEAQMVPLPNAERISSSSTMPQSNTSRTAVAARNSFNATEYRFQPSEMLHENSPHVALASLDQPSNKISRQREEIGERLPHRKRRKSVHGGAAAAAADTYAEAQQLSEFTGRNTRRRKGGTYDLSCPTSPDVIPEVHDDSIGQRLRGASSNLTMRHDSNDMVSESRVENDTNDDSDNNAIAITGVTTLQTQAPILDGHVPEGRSGDADSVVGLPEPLPAVEQQDGDSESTLIARQKVQNPKEVRRREMYRTNLAINLLRFFEMSSEQPIILEEMVALIQDIRKLDTAQPRSDSGDILDQWLTLVDIYLRFRKNMESEIDQRTSNTHRESVEFTESLRKHRILNAARYEVQQWSFKYENHDTYAWSKCATSALLEMASWELDLSKEVIEEMRKTFVKFNEGLVIGRLSLLLS